MATILANKATNFNTNTKEQFQLNQVKWIIKLTKSVESPLFQTVYVHGLSEVKAMKRELTSTLNPLVKGILTPLSQFQVMFT